MNPPPHSDHAVSEVLSTVLLIAIIATVIAVLAVVVFSQTPAQKIPALNAGISANSQVITIQHKGGDAFNYGDIAILLDGVDKSSSFDIQESTGVSDWAAGGTWSVGENLVYEIPPADAVPSSVMVVYTGGNGARVLAASGEGTYGGLLVPAPVVTSITPSSGSVGGVVPITNIAGTNFFSGASVRLSRTGSADIPVSNVVVVSSTKITCDFDLTAAVPGGTAWDVIVTNPNGPSGTLPKAFTIVALPPVAAFSGTPLSGKAPLTVVFTDASTNFPDTWNWSFGDGAFSTLQNPTHTYLAQGNYSVSLTVSNDAGSNTLTKTGYVNVSQMNPPVANFTATPRMGGAPLTVSFTDTSTNSPTSWNWTFVHAYGYLNHGYSSAQNPVFTFPGAGNYSVQLTASNAGGSNTLLREGYIFVYVPVVANFTTTNATTGPKPLTVWFTDLSSGSPTSWYWEFGDIATVNTSTVQNPGHTYDTVGVYSVNLSVANAYSTSYLLRQNYINVTSPPPTAYILQATPSSGMAPLTVSFVGAGSNGPILSYLWHFDDGTADATTSSVSHTFTSAGTYNVSLTVTNAGGSGTAYKTITVYTAPTFTSITPKVGPAAGGQSVTIYGTGFAGATNVTFGGTKNSTPLTVTDTSIITTTPPHTVGTVDVVINTPGGSATGTNAYRYAGIPTFTSITPSPGPLAGGQSVTITGTNLTDTSSVTIAGIQNSSVMTVTDTTITLTTPSYTSAGAVPVVITTPGGSVTAANAYRYYAIQSFTTTGTSSWTVPANVNYVDYLVVGGGGGGGRYGGGGGAGGFRTGTAYSVTPSGSVTVTVGTGGAGATSSTVRGSSGVASVFGTISAAGGGGGGSSGSTSVDDGASGGSGGGGARSTGPGGAGNTPSVSPSQGNNGGTGGTNGSRYLGGGGGGAGATGTAATTTVAGNGGAGSSSSLSGTTTTYAGGGGGGCASQYSAGSGGSGGGGNGGDGAVGTNGSANTGGGGGGSGAANRAAGNGGSGIVIIRYY